MSLIRKFEPPAFHWKMKEYNQQASENLASELGLSLPVAAILVQQGYTSAVSAKNFLNPRLQNLP